MFANATAVLHSTCFRYRFADITNSDIDYTRNHPSHYWHRTKTIPAIEWHNFKSFRTTSCHSGPMYLVVSKSSELVVNVSAGIIFSSCNIKTVWLATPDVATLGFYYSLAVLGAIGDKFWFTNLRRYHSKSKFYDVFKQDECPSFGFKRGFICLGLRSFDPGKTRINLLVSSTRHCIVQRLRKRWW